MYVKKKRKKSDIGGEGGTYRDDENDEQRRRQMLLRVCKYTSCISIIKIYLYVCVSNVCIVDACVHYVKIKRTRVYVPAITIVAQARKRQTFIS